MKFEWWSVFSELHIHTHIYWRIILTVHLAIITAIFSKQENFLKCHSFFITFYLGCFQLLSTFGLVRIYGFFRAAHKELVAEAESRGGAFSDAVFSYSPFPNWVIFAISFLPFILLFFAIWFKTE